MTNFEREQRLCYCSEGNHLIILIYNRFSSLSNRSTIITFIDIMQLSQYGTFTYLILFDTITSVSARKNTFYSPHLATEKTGA